MKKNYLFILALFTTLFSANAQIIEDFFDAYTLGDMADQNPTVWSSSSGDPLSDNALQVIEGGNPGQAGFISAPTGQDVLLLLGNMTTGKGVVSIDMFVPASKTAYLNIQGQTETNGTTGIEGAGNNGNGIFNSANLLFNDGGASPGIFIDETTGETGTYPEDEWFTFRIYFDLFDPSYEIEINGVFVNQAPVAFQSDSYLGAILIYPVDANHQLFIDNIIYGFPIIAAVDDFSPANFSIYPNPVEDVLNIKSKSSIDTIMVYDVLGKLILSSHPSTINPTIDLSALIPGAYFVNVTIGNASKTVKIIK